MTGCPAARNAEVVPALSLGAMRELGARLDWSHLIESDVFNSNKVFAAYLPA